MARIQWYGPESHTNTLLVRGVPGIRAYVGAKGIGVREMAEANLAPHHARNAPKRKPGESVSRIEFQQGYVDAYISLIDEDGGAGAIEFELAPLKRALFSGIY